MVKEQDDLDEEMVQLLKYLFHMDEDTSSDPSQKTDALARVCHLGTGLAQTGVSIEFIGQSA